MFEGLGDPFSGYMSPEDYQRAQEDLSGQFSGIGAEMGVKNVQDPENLDACGALSDICVLVVVAPLQGSPAEAAGLQAGDIVTGVDGESVSGMSLDDAIQRVRGEAGTDVTLTIRRGDGDPFDLTITRDQIQMREVTSEVIADGRVGYVALHGFSRAAADQLHEAIGDLLDAGVESLVFDLRNNPGGFIEVANQVASEFIGDGLIFIQESSGDEVKQWTATDEGLATSPELPVVVLVNGGSASASEIVAAALKERERATILGQPTYGKNTVQVWTELENGGGVRITVSRWFTPEHNSVAPDGVQPDIDAARTAETPPEEDPALDVALEYLAAQPVAGEEATAPGGPSGAAVPGAVVGIVALRPIC
jgi:carboxyl-terminal processing protease